MSDFEEEIRAAFDRVCAKAGGSECVEFVTFEELRKMGYSEETIKEWSAKGVSERWI